MKQLGWLLVLLLAGCSPAPSPVASYPARLANLLDVPAPTVETPLLAKGGGRAWAVTVPPLTISLRQTWALRKCQLLGLIGERNGPLGKTAPPSQRFLYSLQLLQGLRQCRHTDPQVEALAQQLAKQKARRLPFEAWQLLAEDPAFLANWRFDKTPMGDFAGLDNTQTLFHDINALLQGANNALMARLETELGQFSQSRFLARLNQQLANSTAELNAVTQLLARYGPDVVCLHGRPGSQAKRIRDFFFSYYGKRVQPYLGQLSQSDNLTKPALATLIAQLPHPDNPQINRYAGIGPGSISADFKAALHRHTQQWQQFLGRCGLRPGQ